MLLTNPIHSFALCEAEYTLGGWIYCEMYCGIYSWLWKMMWDIFWEIFCNILWDVEYMLPLNPIHSFALWELLFCCCTVCSAHGTWICFSHFCASFSFLLLSVACILFFVSHTCLLFLEPFLATKKARSWRKLVIWNSYNSAIFLMGAKRQITKQHIRGWFSALMVLTRFLSFWKLYLSNFKCGFLTSCNLYPQKATGIPTQDGLENKTWMFFDSTNNISLFL